MFSPNDIRYKAEELTDFAVQMLQRTGLAGDRAQIVAEALVESDLMGHTTHGLQLLSLYLTQLENGKMKKTGEPIVVQDRGAAVTWDGQYLPGAWLMHLGMELAFERIAQHPVVTLVIRRSHHIGCLAVYPPQATARKLMMLLTCSDPSAAFVAPHGGKTPVYTPDPLAAGISTSGAPIILDISMSTIAVGTALRHRKSQEPLAHPWIIDNAGQPSTDAGVVFDEPRGAILPLGGLDLGYKGFALGLLIEALTSALAGHGRADAPDQFGASVFMQIIDPAAFGGLDSFLNETTWLSEACRQSQPISEENPVRLPGERALKLREEQLKFGVQLAPSIFPSIEKWVEKYGIPFPKTL